MTLITNFPLRQKVVILLTVSVGVFILIAYNLSLVSQEILNLIIFSYGLAVPMILLSFDTLVDLDKKNVFVIWVAISAFFLIAYLTAIGKSDFIVNRSCISESQGISRYISDSWINSLKSIADILIRIFFV